MSELKACSKWPPLTLTQADAIDAQLQQWRRDTTWPTQFWFWYDVWGRPDQWCVFCIPLLRHAQHAQLNTYGSRAFSIAGPTVWNSLPHELRDPACGFDSFRQFLKTILFSLYKCDQRIRGFLKWYALYKFTFYLLTCCSQPDLNLPNLEATVAVKWNLAFLLPGTPQ